jgi:Kef-type K+ transport system membrane component KefB
MRRTLVFYLSTLLIFGLGIVAIVRYGDRVSAVAGAQVPAGTTAAPPNALSILLLQIIVIVVATRAVGYLCNRVRQPAVIGEVLAGIMLGPSLLGLAWPAAHAFLFPRQSLEVLRLLSQVGVILFMFIVGVELEMEFVRRKAQTALLISHASIIVPLFLGTALSLVIYQSYGPAHLPFRVFALFVGVAMSITAFPVLARIIEERGLGGSLLGNIAIACAAVDDVTAWSLLAIVVALVRGGGLGGTLLLVGLAAGFAAAMIFVARPLITHLLRGGAGVEGDLPSWQVAGLLVFALASALVTETIGFHALFGAFLAGVVMPPNARLRAFLRERLETISAVLLLPLFFAFTGLRTEVGLLNDWQTWGVCAAIIAVAIAGKLGGTAVAARWTGMSWHNALFLGTLMNTRGLVELIVLNIGRDLGILSPRMFTMMVLMALATTFMTGPLLGLLEWARRRRHGPLPKEASTR